MRLSILLLIGMLGSVTQIDHVITENDIHYGIYITSPDVWDESIIGDVGCTIEKITTGLYFATCPRILSEDQLNKLRKLDTEIEQVKFYELKPKIPRKLPRKRNKLFLTLEQDNVNKKLDLYDKMGITQAWENGYTGRGVLVAVVDVGVNTDHPYLKPNIDTGHSFNVVDNNTRVTPFRSDSYPLSSSDHGNNCAGLVAATNTTKNDCGPGVAFDARIAVIKVFGKTDHRDQKFTTEHLYKGLNTYRDNVDVYSNSWGSRDSFNSIDLMTRKVLEINTREGRGGKGCIYIFPAGPIADGYASDIHTIVVNGLDRTRHMTDYTEKISSSVLTSAYGDGMRTTEDLQNGHYCTNNFEGTSAAVPVVAGIVAQALQINQDLTWRDVQHLVVKSSSRNGLPDDNQFKQNAAGLSYHDGLGFGLINASKMTELARKWENVPAETSMSINSVSPCTQEFDGNYRPYCFFKFEVSEGGVERIEHVKVTLSFSTSDEKSMEIHLYSPSETRSILMGKRQSDQDDTSRCMSLMSVHFWDETPLGGWKLILLSLNHGTVESSKAKLTIRGSRNNKISTLTSPTDEYSSDQQFCRTPDTTPPPALSTSIYSDWITILTCISWHLVVINLVFINV